MKAPGLRSRHGLNSLKARVAVRGLQAIDRRTLAARGLLEWRQRLMIDLGGEDTLSAQQNAIIEAVVRTRLFLEHVDGFLLAQPSLIDRRRRALLPVLKERNALQDSLLRLLVALGLERRAKPVTDIAAMFAKMHEQDKEGDPELEQAPLPTEEAAP